MGWHRFEHYRDILFTCVIHKHVLLHIIDQPFDIYDI